MVRTALRTRAGADEGRDSTDLRLGVSTACPSVIDRGLNGGARNLPADFDLTGKTALVTGASRGLGQTSAAPSPTPAPTWPSPAARSSRSPRSATRSPRWAAGPCRSSSTCATTTASSVWRPRRIDALGHIDILVNNAGCNIRKPAVDVTWDDWNTILDTNLRGTFFVAQAVARHMIPRGYGRIINIGSVTCVCGYAGLAPYGASRGGVKQMTMSLADDWGPHGITVNCLAPGWFKTAQNRALYENEGWVEYLCDRIPLKRPGKPDDLEGAVVFLASDASEYVTGQTLLVDGGITVGAVKALVNKPT